MPTITSRQNPLVARYRAAARREDDGVMLLDGAHLVGEAVSAGVRIDHVTMTAAAREDPRLATLIDKLLRAGVDMVIASPPVMDAISPVKSSSAIAALAQRPSAARESLFAATQALVVVAVDIQDPGNAGAMVRVAEAGGATGMIPCGGTADPFGWKALRGSMGSAFRLPIADRMSAIDAVAEARHHACRIVAAAPRGGRSFFDIDFAGATAILIGGEGAGLPPAIVDAADERITVPMQAPVESLNAAVTAALIVYEASRQRDIKRR